MNVGLWDVAAVVIKAITYAATFGVTGGMLFRVYSAHLISTQHDYAIRRWVMGCAVVAVVGSLVRISVLAGSMAEGAAGMFDSGMLSMVLQAGENRGSGLRIAGVVLASFGVVLGHRVTAVTVAGALIACASFAEVGHAWASGERALLVGAESVHLVGAAFWLGALPPLRWIAGTGTLPQLASVARRFGDVAIWMVAVLIAAGIALLTRLIGSASELWTTSYGRLVMLKVSAVACLLGLATINRWRLTPRLLANDWQAARAFRMSIDTELAVGGAILFVTAAMTTITGPGSLD